MIRVDQMLPTVMIILSIGAAVVYVVKGDIGRGCYWFFGACIAITVTFLVR